MDFSWSYTQGILSMKRSPKLFSGGHLVLSKPWLQLKKNSARSTQGEPSHQEEVAKQGPLLLLKFDTFIGKDTC